MLIKVYQFSYLISYFLFDITLPLKGNITEQYEQQYNSALGKKRLNVADFICFVCQFVNFVLDS